MRTRVFLDRPPVLPARRPIQKEARAIDNEITMGQTIRMVAAQVWKCIVAAVLVLFPAGLRAEHGTDQTKPYGVISILESSDEEVETLGNAGQISAKRMVMAYVTANKPCELLIAVFTRNGRRLAHGWKPQWVSLEEWQQRTVTLGSYVSAADPQKRKAVEVWALFLVPQPAGVKEAAA
jgi:hypothetical protein